MSIRWFVKFPEEGATLTLFGRKFMFFYSNLPKCQKIMSRNVVRTIRNVYSLSGAGQVVFIAAPVQLYNSIEVKTNQIICLFGYPCHKRKYYFWKGPVSKNSNWWKVQGTLTSHIVGFLSGNSAHLSFFFFFKMAEKPQQQQPGTELDQSQFCCSVCLDLFREPVTVPCGHSYCRSCIEACWREEEEAVTGRYSCPQCRKVFQPRPVLGRNIILAEVKPLHSLLRCCLLFYETVRGQVAEVYKELKHVGYTKLKSVLVF